MVKGKKPTMSLSEVTTHFVEATEDFLASHRHWLFAVLASLDDQIQEGQHESILVALGKATLVVPHAWTFATRFLDKANPPFKR